MSSKDQKTPSVTQTPIEMHPANLPPPATAPPAASRTTTAVTARTSGARPKQQSILINLKCSWSSQVIPNCPFFADMQFDVLLDTFRRFFISFPRNPDRIDFYCNSRLINPWSLDTTIADAEMRSGDTVCMVVPNLLTGPGYGTSCPEGLLAGLQFTRAVFEPTPAHVSHGIPSRQDPMPMGNHAISFWSPKEGMPAPIPTVPDSSAIISSVEGEDSDSKEILPSSRRVPFGRSIHRELNTSSTMNASVDIAPPPHLPNLCQMYEGRHWADLTRSSISASSPALAHAVVTSPNSSVAVASPISPQAVSSAMDPPSFVASGIHTPKQTTVATAEEHRLQRASKEEDDQVAPSSHRLPTLTIGGTTIRCIFLRQPTDDELDPDGYRRRLRSVFVEVKVQATISDGELIRWAQRLDSPLAIERWEKDERSLAIIEFGSREAARRAIRGPDRRMRIYWSLRPASTWMPQFVSSVTTTTTPATADGPELSIAHRFELQKKTTSPADPPVMPQSTPYPWLEKLRQSLYGNAAAPAENGLPSATATLPQPPAVVPTTEAIAPRRSPPPVGKQDTDFVQAWRAVVKRIQQTTNPDPSHHKIEESEELLQLFHLCDNRPDLHAKATLLHAAALMLSRNDAVAGATTGLIGSISDKGHDSLNSRVCDTVNALMTIYALLRPTSGSKLDGFLHKILSLKEHHNLTCVVESAEALLQKGDKDQGIARLLSLYGLQKDSSKLASKITKCATPVNFRFFDDPEQCKKFVLGDDALKRLS
jgi:hypothetical protein